MDELTLISHMTGGGEAVANKLRERGLADISVLLGRHPDALAKELDVEREAAQRIIVAARTIRGEGPARPKTQGRRQATKALAAAEHAISTVITRAPKKGSRAAGAGVVKQNQRMRYGKLLFPILGLVLLGAMLRGRG